MLTWQAVIEGRLRLATEQAKLNTASRMGESELEWTVVTPGGMTVCHSTFFCLFGVARNMQKAVD